MDELRLGNGTVPSAHAMSLWDTFPYSLRQMQYLVAVADLGGFRKAADACGVAQPSMSAQIAQVEQALGVQIFERSTRGVRITAAGAAVIDRSRSRRHRAAAQRSVERYGADRRHPDGVSVPAA